MGWNDSGIDDHKGELKESEISTLAETATTVDRAEDSKFQMRSPIEDSKGTSRTPKDFMEASDSSCLGFTRRNSTQQHDDSRSDDKTICDDVKTDQVTHQGRNIYGEADPSILDAPRISNRSASTISSETTKGSTFGAPLRVPLRDTVGIPSGADRSFTSDSKTSSLRHSVRNTVEAGLLANEPSSEEPAVQQNEGFFKIGRLVSQFLKFTKVE